MLTSAAPGRPVAVTPVDDPRLETFDAFKGVECNALYDRVTRALASKPPRQ